MQGIATLDTNPANGLYQFKDAADLLADFGREGDTYIVHAAEGETVIPVEVLESNPRMKKMLFKQMEEMGLDPERYIVGNELNSINPVTGQPEFFLKKLFKSVKNVVKKVAPIALPIIAPMLLPAMPLALSAGLGSFVGSKVGGASTQDSFKNALLTGGIAGLGSYMKSGNFASSPQQMGLSAKQPVQTGDSTSKGFMEKYIYDSAPNTPEGGEAFLEKYLSPSRSSIDPMVKAEADILKTNELLKSKGLPELNSTQVQEKLLQAAKSQPSALQKFLPLGLTALAGTALAGAASQKQEEEALPLMPTGQDLLDEDRASGTYQYAFDPNIFYGSNPFYASPVFRAGGGEIIGPGTATSDSIPAMLSDGEFVMTASAVKGAGGGDRNKGAKKMYSMMRQYERMA